MVFPLMKTDHLLPGKGTQGEAYESDGEGLAGQ